MTKDQYVCQRAANAIISEIGPYQISSDALQSINQFLDQVLMLLLERTQSFDLSIIKSQVLTLLPLSLGKNAIVEAELEVKTYSETSVIDYPLYERMRSFHSTMFPLDHISNSLRRQCIDHCTLANKASDSPTFSDGNKDQGQVVAISPMVIIYITTVLEHMAEYILTTIAVTADHEDTEYIRVKEVYLALLDDVQVGDLFQQTDIRTKLEKRVISYQRITTLPSPAPSPAMSYTVSQDTFEHHNHHTPELYSDYRQSLQDDNDIDDDDFSSEPPPSAHTQTSFSIKSSQSSPFYRPVSVLSNGTTGTNRSTSSSKKGFRFFGKKDKRSSVASHSTANTNYQQDHYRRTMSPPPSAPGYSPSSVQVYDPDAPALDFEDLIRSGNTMKVSLTPNRLRSIEVKSTVYEPTLSPFNSNLSSSTSPTTKGKSSAISLPSSSNPLPPIAAPFENPRAAPKPPIAHHQPTLAPNHQQTPPLTPDSSIASRLSNARSPPPSFDEGQRSPKQQPHRTYVNNKYIKQPPPAPLQLVGRTNQQEQQQHRKQLSVETVEDEVCAMNLPSPPNTTDRHPSSTTFSALSDHPTPSSPTPSSGPTNKPRYSRPSSMVAKRASGSARPPSYHESFALTMEQQQLQNGYTPSVDSHVRSPPTGSSASGSSNHPPTSIVPSPLRSSTPPIPSTVTPTSPLIGSSTTATVSSMDHKVTSPRTMMRRRTTRPLSQMIVEETNQTDIADQKNDTSSKATRLSNNDVPENQTAGPQSPGTIDEGTAVPLQDKDTIFTMASTTSYDRRDRILQLLQQQRKPTMMDSSTQTDALPGIPSLASLLERSSLSTKTSVPILIVPDEQEQGRTPRAGSDRSAVYTLDGGSTSGSERGLVDGDEEWFMQDEDWEDTQDQDSVMAEWLLGEN